MSRREFLQAVVAAGGLAFVPPSLAAGARSIRAHPAFAALVGVPHLDTPVWTYGGTVPGPELRLKQGERLRVELENGLPEDTTVHWHGIRLPNAMDGVPHLTQPPIKANGGRFLYEFDLPDAGTFWYHPHLGSSTQVGRGVYAPLIVEEDKPPPFDRDVVWMLGDWRLDSKARVVDDFHNFRDASHAGRIGNTVTVNGAVREAFQVRAGERLRLRLINAANARVFALSFEGHDPLVVALDGHPVTPHRPEGGRVLLGPAMRADILLDGMGEPGRSYPVMDDYYPEGAYRLLDLRYAKAVARGARAGVALPQLPANPIAEPDLARAERHRVEFGGGMMGNMPGMAMMSGLAWTVNGEPMADHEQGHEPVLTLGLGRSYVLELVNDTQWDHPIHLHGHAFRVISRDGRGTPHREWRDTVLMPPRTRAEIAFVADNPGDWMIHCHVLEHQHSGFMAVIRVA